jgi:hypothetical protein
MTEKVIKLTKSEWLMLHKAWDCYAYDFWDEINEGGDIRKIKVWEKINEKLHE